MSRRIESEMDYSGGKYDGEVDDTGLPHGKGTKKNDDGSIYIGEFVKGIKEGKGNFAFACGDTYIGTHRDSYTLVFFIFLCLSFGSLPCITNDVTFFAFIHSIQSNELLEFRCIRHNKIGAVINGCIF